MTSRKNSTGKIISAEDSELFRRAIDESWPVEDSTSLNKRDLNFYDDHTQEHPSTNKHSSTLSTKDAGVLRDEGDLFYRSGVRKQTLKNLKRGRLTICDEIDLHGYTKHEAIHRLHHFLSKAIVTESGCVRVVTGKGRSSPSNYSVVREATLSQLRHEPRVLAYCIAIPSDGGTGALYVLLSC
jgi:DNA-nicking Smr family endonuclease